MNHLIVFAHPNPKSFGKAIEETVIKASETKGFSPKVKDLYKEGFNPVLGTPVFRRSTIC
jgi:NAD(P)H dehydrogenase (quinone)